MASIPDHLAYRTGGGAPRDDDPGDGGGPAERGGEAGKSSREWEDLPSLTRARRGCAAAAVPAAGCDGATAASAEAAEEASVAAAAAAAAVVVVGGHRGSGRTAESYDVGSGTWSPSPAPLRRRCGCAAAAMVRPAPPGGGGVGGAGAGAGGGRTSRPRSAEAAVVVVVVAGGFDGAEALDSAEAYDLSSRAWTALPPMGARRQRPAAAAVGDKVYVVRGHNGPEWLNSAEVYDGARGTWSDLPPMRSRRKACAAAAVEWSDDDGGGEGEGRSESGRRRRRLVVVAGGNDGRARLDSAEAFDVDEGRWLDLPPMGRRRWGCAAAAVCRGRYVVVAGGYDGRERLASVEAFDVAGWRWVDLPPLRTARDSCAMVAVVAPSDGASGGRVLVVGGSGEGPLKSFEALALPSSWLLSPRRQLVSSASQPCSDGTKPDTPQAGARAEPSRPAAHPAEVRSTVTARTSPQPPPLQRPEGLRHTGVSGTFANLGIGKSENGEGSSPRASRARAGASGGAAPRELTDADDKGAAADGPYLPIPRRRSKRIKTGGPVDDGRGIMRRLLCIDGEAEGNGRPLNRGDSSARAQAPLPLPSEYLYACTGGFSEGRSLGEGFFGKVYLGTDPVLRRKFAVKRLRLKPLGEDPDRARRAFERELAALRYFRHPNVARLHGYCLSDDLRRDQCLVFELASQRSLRDFLRRKAEGICHMP